MRPPGYGEGQPRLDDDRLPVILVILDGLGDRTVPELGDRTPSEAACTPVLDELTRRGSSGWHLPFGWGRAASSETSHWAMFGYADTPFCGRAVLEALGAGLDVPEGAAVTFGALRTSEVDGNRLMITGRAAPADRRDAERLLEALAPVLAAYGGRLEPLGGRGEALVTFSGCPSGDISDSDPFFEDFHPWLHVLPLRPEATSLAGRVNDALLHARSTLVAHPANRARSQRGQPPLDVLTTKWSGQRQPIEAFCEHVGVQGAAVTSTRLYRGLAEMLSMPHTHLEPERSVTRDLSVRLDAASTLVEAGARFVHVHTKVTDEAGHSKLPHAKRQALEAADAGLEALLALSTDAIVAVTGDHATPSTGGVLHTGDPTPLVVAGPTVRADGVASFGEGPMHGGWYGVVQADDILPLLFGHANRPSFLGHRLSRRATPALPDSPLPMPLSGSAGSSADGRHPPAVPAELAEDRSV